ncbi:MAG: outer membrane beta-barrel protein [Gemmatimonadetes bacterium]|nr:outer membrane beta-barrel protein [Gemmatimonadota bacterium]
MRVTLMASMALVAAAPAAAQIDTALPSTAAIQLGSLSLYPSITIKDIGIDSNVFNDAEEPKEDFSFTVRPQVQAALRLGPARLIGTGGGNFVYYQKYKNEQSTDSRLGGRFEMLSTRLLPFATVSRTRSRERTGFEIDARARRLDTDVSVGTDFEITAVTSLTAFVRRNRLEYDAGQRFRGEDLAAELNRTSEIAGAGAKFALTPLTTLIVAVELQRDRFEESNLRDADALRVAPALEFATAAAVTGRISLGYREFRPLHSGLPRRRDFVASAGTTITVLGRTLFDVEANRDVVYSPDVTSPYYLAEGGRLVVTQRLAGPFDVIGIGGWQRLRYQTLGGAPLDGRTETTTTVGGGVGFRLTPNLRVALTYDLTERSSSEPGDRSYDRRRILGAVNYGL